MNKKAIIGISAVLGFLLLSGLVVFSFIRDNGMKIGFAENNYGHTMSASFYYYDGTNKKKVTLNKGDEVTLAYNMDAKKGALEMIVKDQGGNEVLKKSDGTGEASFTANETQEYSIEIVAIKAKGKYKLTWSK